MDQHEVEVPPMSGTQVVAAVVGMLLATAVALGMVAMGDTAADAEAEQWRACIASAQEMEFEPAGGSEAWCVTTQ